MAATIIRQASKTIIIILFLTLLNMLLPYSSHAAATYSSDDGGWICTHGYHTFSDKHLTYGHKNVPYWCSALFNETSNPIQEKQIKKGLARWTNADSSITFTKASPSSDSRISFGAVRIKEGTLAVTKYFTSAKSELIPTPTSELSSNYKYAYIYIDQKELGKINSETERVATISHEIGHAFGLSHRNSTPSSIMCQVKKGRSANTPKPKDVKTVKHIY